jgi:hypothetical protein
MASERWSRGQNQGEAQRLVEQLVQSQEPKVLVYLPLAPRPADLSAVGRNYGAGSTRVFDKELKDDH